ncbi:TPA: 5' exonuclease Apollo [Trebouxia sp. C0004]
MSDGYLLACGKSAIAIDYWTAPRASAFFLTHMHADHYKGLHDDWCQGTIYCSEVTGLLLQRKWPRLSPKSIPTDEPLSIQLSTDERLTVTAIAANHCPGAVMLLFEGVCGRVLHTGDFRWEHGIQAELLQHPALTAGALSLVVLDNTYCHPRYSFPCRLEACQSIISLIQTHTDMDIVLGIDSLGKEDMLAAIAHATGVPVGIAAERLETVSIAGLPTELFTVHMSSTRIRALPKWMVTVEMIAKLNRSKPTLGIIPTGFACLGTNSKPVTKLRTSNSAPSVLTSANSAHYRHCMQVRSEICTPVPSHALDQHVLFPGSDIGQLSDRHGTVLHLPEQHVRSAGQIDSNTGHVLQQQSGGCGQMSQLFSQAEMLEDDLKAYAALVHEQKADSSSQAPSAAEIEAALPLLHKVPYSLHSSYSELESFVAHLRPEAIVPIVKKCYDSRYPIDPNLHLKHLLGRAMPVDAQQHGQTCGRGRKRKVQGRATRENGTDEKSDCCWQHGKWQGILHSCANQVKQKRLPARPLFHTACSISACFPPTAVSAYPAVNVGCQDLQAQCVPHGPTLASQAVKAEGVSQEQSVSNAACAEQPTQQPPGQCSQHQLDPCEPCGPAQVTKRRMPIWGRAMQNS